MLYGWRFANRHIPCFRGFLGIIIDGFEGDKIKYIDSPHYGKRRKKGWRNAGGPWTYVLDPDLMFPPHGQPQKQYM